MNERGLSLVHSTVFRWVQYYAPELNKRMRTHLKMSGASYRIDETYVKAGVQWNYLMPSLLLKRRKCCPWTASYAV